VNCVNIFYKYILLYCNFDGSSSKNNNDTIENLFLLNSEHDIVYAHNYIETLKNDNKSNF